MGIKNLVKLRTKNFMGLENQEFYPISKTTDEIGNSLTYKVHLPDRPMEFNTLKEAKRMAIKTNKW